MKSGPVYWHQGLFLQPQHFQVLQGQLEEALSPLLAGITPFFWGFSSLEISEAALSTNRLEVKALKIIFPSSANMFTYPGNSVCGGRQVPVNSIPVDGSLMAYLGIRPARPGQANVTVAQSQDQMVTATTRMAVPQEPDSVPDTYSNGPSAQLRLMSYVLTLIFENELDQAGDMDLIPLARLRRKGDSISMDHNYAPPCLNVAASPLLSSMLKEIRDRIMGKGHQLEGYKNLSPGAGQSGDFVLLLLALRTLSRFSVRLDHSVEAPCFTPWEAYGMLRELVAELSVFSLNVSLSGRTWQDEKLVPDYSHTRLAQCFKSIFDVITSLLEGISAGPRFVTRFEFRDPYWVAEVPQQVMSEARASGYEFWLVLNSDQTPADELTSSALNMLKLSSPGSMESLLIRALPGLPLSFSETAPPGMPRVPGSIYFFIGQDSPLWAEVEKKGILSMHWAGAPEDLSAQLAVLTR